MEERFTKNHYKIREVAEIIGVPPSTLRFWETEFDGLSPRRSASNQRSYSRSDLELLEIINYLLHTKGLKMEAAKDYLRKNKKNLSRKMQVLDKLEEVRDELDLLLKSLTKRGEKLGLSDS